MASLTKTSAGSQPSTSATTLLCIIKAFKNRLEFTNLILKMKQDAVVKVVKTAIHGRVWSSSQVVRQVRVSKGDRDSSQSSILRQKRTGHRRVLSRRTRLGTAWFNCWRTVFGRWKAMFLFVRKASVDRWWLTGMVLFHAGFGLDICFRKWLHTTASSASEFGRRGIRKVGTEHCLLVGSDSVAPPSLCRLGPTLVVIAIFSKLKLLAWRSFWDSVNWWSGTAFDAICVGPLCGPLTMDAVSLVGRSEFTRVWSTLRVLWARGWDAVWFLVFRFFLMILALVVVPFVTSIVIIVPRLIVGHAKVARGILSGVHMVPSSTKDSCGHFRDIRVKHGPKIRRVAADLATTKAPPIATIKARSGWWALASHGVLGSGTIHWVSLLLLLMLLMLLL